MNLTTAILWADSTDDSESSYLFQSGYKTSLGKNRSGNSPSVLAVPLESKGLL